jgi:S1-C subfamily serine protease
MAPAAMIVATAEGDLMAGPARTLLGALLILAVAAATAAADTSLRYEARFTDGSRVEGGTLAEWHSGGSSPKLEGRELLNPGNRFRWLRDRRLRLGSAPEAFVEMIGGDRLPGIAVEYRSGTSDYDAAPDRFLVQPAVEVGRKPASPGDTVVGVRARFVRRLVWRRRDIDRYEPGRAFFRDGRTVAFRTARFSGRRVMLLAEEGPKTADYEELAELHLPEADPWNAYFDELSLLSPDGDSPLLQLETSEGLIATASLSRFLAETSGNPRDPERWLHAVQPAWCEDLLWISGATIAMRRLHAPHEVPLSRIAPAVSRRRGVLGGGGRHVQRDRNVEGGTIVHAGNEYGWGFGLHASCELHFPLPAVARSFRSRVGLDELAGAGGCVRAAVYVNARDAAPRFQSDFLVGARATADTGTIALAGPDQDERTLILHVDAAHSGRPSGADPLDIRDLADWLEPQLELDRDRLKEEIARRHAQPLPALAEWELSPEPGGSIERLSQRDELAGDPGRFVAGVSARGEPLRLTRETRLSPRDLWLVLVASRPRNTSKPPKVEVRVNSELAGEFVVPLRDVGNREFSPLVVPLAAFMQGPAARQVKLEIRQTPGSENVPVFWHAVRITEHLPTLYELFDEQGVFAAVEAPAGAEATLVDNDRHSGRRSAKVPPDGRYRVALREPVSIRQHPAWGEYRYARFAFRKFGGGRVCLEFDHSRSGEKPARYDAGSGEPCHGSARRVWELDLPGEWIVITRDLFADFGPLELTGFTLSAPQGSHALFDHVYLARSERDFASVAAHISPDEANQKARRELASGLIERTRPAVVAIDLGGRFATGTIVTGARLVLTSGHALAGAADEVTVHLADGRQLRGKRLGISRETDSGLIRLVEPGDVPYLELDLRRDLAAGELFLAMAHGGTHRPGDAPAIHVVGLRHDFRLDAWTDFSPPSRVSGGPLLSRDGKVVGVDSRASTFGGVLFRKASAFAEHWERLQRGERFGDWGHNTGPMLGVQVDSTEAGARVSQVFADSPAAQAGFRAGDFIRRVEGRSIVSLEDIYAVLSDKDPGQEVTVETAREQQTIQTKLTLAPRVP